MRRTLGEDDVVERHQVLGRHDEGLGVQLAEWAAGRVFDQGHLHILHLEAGEYKRRMSVRHAAWRSASAASSTLRMAGTSRSEVLTMVNVPCATLLKDSPPTCTEVRVAECQSGVSA
jgi:hypothetical protein